MARDPHRARLDIVVWMYTQRFPYEESEGDLYTSSKIEAKADKPDLMSNECIQRTRTRAPLMLMLARLG
ncbi:hypothetical protein [Nitrosomonas sp.]|uniref:hypothetical protein n=1 Tax=Nitrosomonas sp. TaxID=42353 RepID=UPI002730486B|nr:hypothetical protein [Nitrosomonas sp.]MDP2224187.1 hypothetical protein [Nitrosomonas sp.]